MQIFDTSANLLWEGDITDKKALVGKNLAHADLACRDLSGMDLTRTRLTYAKMECMRLIGAQLYGASLLGASLTRADLTDACMHHALCECARLDYACCRRTDFTGAELEHVQMDGVNLSGAIGLLDPSDWLTNNFATDERGIIVYKRLGAFGAEYPSPEHWQRRPDAVLTEVVNPCRTDPCGCGVNFGTRQWCDRNYTKVALWECRIAWRDLPGVVVPYATDGKARCARLTLLRIVEDGRP